MSMKLLAGERFRLSDETKFIKVTSGKVEAYAVTKKKISFRQIFLMELTAGEAAFPSLDEFETIDVSLYAVEDSEFEEISFDDVDAETLASMMRRWFVQLIKLPWMRLLADRGDEILQQWTSTNFLSGYGQDHDALITDFEDNESIFAMLLGMRFGAQDEILSRRMEIREKQKQRLINETISMLLGEEKVSEDDSGTGNRKFEEAVYIVRCAANALKMPDRDIRLAPEMVKKLDQLGLIRRLAQKGGIQIRLIRLENGWHKDDSGVIIGYYGEKKELAALLPDTPNSYRLVTRENYDGIIVTDEVAAKIDTDAFLCYAGLPSKKLNRSDFLKFMFRQSWKTDWKTILFVSLAAGLIPLITPVVTETIFKDIIPILDRKGLATVTQVVMVAGFTTAALTTVRSVAMLRFTSRTGMAGAAALLSRILSLPTKFFRDFQSGELASRIMGMDMIEGLISGEMTGIIFSFIFSFWSLGLMFYYSMKLTGIALLIWLVYMIISGFILRRLVRSQKKMTEANNKTAGILQQIFTGLVKFRVKGAEEQAYHLWGEKFAEEWKHNYSVRWLKNYNLIIASVQPILLSLALYYFGLKELAETSTNAAGGGAAASLFEAAEPMTAATFIAFQAAYSAFNTALIAIMPVLEEMSVIHPLLENLRPILEAEPESADDKIESDVLSGAIEVRNLTFAYGAGKPEVLKDISFSIAAGEHVAIVGKSGCGKSTLIRLLLGFESPKSGAVYYDGQDLSELNLASVRSQMGVVLQNGQLMTGDILHNIIGTNDLTPDDAWAAAEAAGVADDIREMPMQMQTIVSEGSTNISGGQRQRILIARALALKPSIIICDEATSALDNRTQAIVTESLDRLQATRIVVAHRLSTIRHANRIIVLNEGRIAESGTFDELVKQGGIFASFVKRQVA